MLDDKPGAPPSTEPVKPKISNDSKISFAYNQLIFNDYFIIDGRRYIRFFVEGEKPCYVDVFYGEFIEYQLSVWEQKNLAVEKEQPCSCDLTTPQYDLIENISVTVTVVNEETEETTEIVQEIPVYFIYSLSENIKVGNICKIDK